MRLSRSDLDIIQQVKVLLETAFRYEYTQAELARRYHINESKLRKGFLLVHKVRIYEYQVKIRLAKAKEQLAFTDKPIKCIAYTVGYDLKSLEKQFKKQTGLSPVAWRKSYSAYTTSIVA